MKIAFTFLIFFYLTIGAIADGNDEKSEITAKNTAELYINGTVTDKTSGEALVGVKIELEGTDKKAYTDYDGKFTFENVKPGKYNISAQYISYKHGQLKNKSIDILNTSLKLELSPLN